MSHAHESVLSRLESWYHSHCDGEWEHGFGIHIGTLDNPGWTIEIDLKGTRLARKRFQKIIDGEEDSNYDDEGKNIGPWMTCWVAAGKFKAACGPRDLERCLGVFLEWTDGTPNR